MTFSLFQFATSKLVPNKAMVPACIMQLQKTQAKHQSRLVVCTYTISDIYGYPPPSRPDGGIPHPDLVEGGTPGTPTIQTWSVGMYPIQTWSGGTPGTPPPSRPGMWYPQT